MANAESTCWTVIEGAAAGNARDREHFARCYVPVVRAYLAARWRGSPCRRELDDAVQEVFVECFRQHGVLARVERERPGGFRAFLYGVARNLALRVEARHVHGREEQAPSALDLNQVAAEESGLSQTFDRAWARALLQEAGERHATCARQAGEEAQRRREILRLRFQDGLPIREIARRWGMDAAVLHHEYARARQEFRTALRAVVAFHHTGAPRDIDRECATLLTLLG
jgi:RNA polymerase sigma-70 factor (ECF subfamily)